MQHPDYFCNIHMKHLQYNYETSETHKICVYNMREAVASQFQPPGLEHEHHQPDAHGREWSDLQKVGTHDRQEIGASGAGWARATATPAPAPTPTEVDAL